MTPYYAAATWYGYDDPEVISYSLGNPASKIWAAIMKDIHKELPSKTFDKPSTIVTARICKDSGKSATGSCSNTYIEEFASGTVPAACDGHGKVKVCKESGKLANEYCKDVEERTILKAPEKERNASWKTSAGKKYSTIKETCTIHTEETSNEDDNQDDEHDNGNEDGENSNTPGNPEEPEKPKEPEEKMVEVPVVVGKTLEDAKSTLDSVNLRYKIEYGSDESKDNGIVLKQARKAGEKVKEETIVTLTINKKKENKDENKNENKVKNEISNTVDKNNTIDHSTHN